MYKDYKPIKRKISNTHIPINNKKRRSQNFDKGIFFDKDKYAVKLISHDLLTNEKNLWRWELLLQIFEYGNGTERYYKNYREIIIDYIEYHKEELKDYFTDDEESNPHRSLTIKTKIQKLNEYILKMQKKMDSMPDLWK